MMKFVIHFTLADGSEDKILIQGDNIEQLQEQAREEVVKRGGRDPWSEEL